MVKIAKTRGRNHLAHNFYIGRDIEITNAEMETKYERLLSSYRIEERE